MQPKGSDQYLFGFGAYAMDMPDVLVGFNPNNKDVGWDVCINISTSLFGEYRFSEVNKGWFAGTQMGVQQFQIENEGLSGSEKFNNLLAMGYFGYTLKPFGERWYIKPWAGVGYTNRLSGNNSLGDLAYDIAPVTMFLTVHLGYTF